LRPDGGVRGSPDAQRIEREPGLPVVTAPAERTKN
jgi:hypothetical protein